MSKTLLKVVALLPSEITLYLVAIDRIATVMSRAVADKRDKITVTFDAGANPGAEDFP